MNDSSVVKCSQCDALATHVEILELDYQLFLCHNHFKEWQRHQAVYPHKLEPGQIDLTKPWYHENHPESCDGMCYAKDESDCKICVWSWIVSFVNRN
jgi:hypothetical protein